MRTGERTAIEIGWLRGGNWRATQTALTVLCRRGALRPGRVGTVERVRCSLVDAAPLERALYGVVYGPVGPRELMEKPRVRSAMGDVRRTVIEAGLVRPGWRRVVVPVALVVLPALVFARLAALDVVAPWTGVPALLALSAAGGAFAFRRTVSGARTLAAMRRRHADLGRVADGAATLTPDEAGLAVALFGAAALVAVVPAAARDGGLLDGGRRTPGMAQPAATPIQSGG